MRRALFLGMVPALLGSARSLQQDAYVRGLLERATDLTRLQQSRIACEGFGEIASAATWGLGISSGALLVTTGVFLFGRSRSGAGDRPLAAIGVVGGVLLAALAVHNAALARAFLDVSHEWTAAEQTAQLTASALGRASGAWFCALAATPGLIVLQAFGARQRVGLVLLAVLGLQHWQWTSRKAAVADLADKLPADVELVASNSARFSKRAEVSGLLVGSSQLYWRESRATARPLAQASILDSPDCLERLATTLKAALRPRPQRLAVALDRRVSARGMLCLTAALASFDDAEPAFRGPTPIEWLVRDVPQPLPPPFDVLAIEIGNVQLQVLTRLLHPEITNEMAHEIADERAFKQEPKPAPRAVTDESPKPNASEVPPVAEGLLRFGALDVQGRIPDEVVARVVKQRRSQFGGCYAVGRVNNPSLEGRVRARFVIARDGSVSVVSNGGSTLPDSRTIDCVLRQFATLTFPPSPEGIATVTYSLNFSPD